MNICRLQSQRVRQVINPLRNIRTFVIGKDIRAKRWFQQSRCISPRLVWLSKDSVQIEKL